MFNGSVIVSSYVASLKNVVRCFLQLNEGSQLFDAFAQAPEVPHIRVAFPLDSESVGLRTACRMSCIHL
jgi:hypothetical protein